MYCIWQILTVNSNYDHQFYKDEKFLHPWISRTFTSVLWTCVSSLLVHLPGYCSRKYFHFSICCLWEVPAKTDVSGLLSPGTERLNIWHGDSPEDHIKILVWWQLYFFLRVFYTDVLCSLFRISDLFHLAGDGSRSIYCDMYSTALSGPYHKWHHICALWVCLVHTSAFDGSYCTPCSHSTFL